MLGLKACLTLALAETAGLIGSSNLTKASPSAALQMFLILLVFQYGLSILYNVAIYPIFFSPLRKLPGPTDNHFFFGQTIKQFKAPSPTALYVEWSRRWPDAPLIRYFEMGGRETLLLNSVQTHKEILQTHSYSTVKPEFISRLICEITGRGVFGTEGAEHKKQRRLLAGCFSPPNLRKLLPTFRSKAKALVSFLEGEMGKSPTGTVEFQAAFSKATLDVIASAVLGVELKNLSTETATMDFMQCYDRMLNQPPLSGLITFINVIVPIRWLLPIEANLGFVRASNQVRKLLLGVVRERIEALGDSSRSFSESEPTQPTRRDILTFMLEEKYTGEDAWTENDILEHLLNFMAGGYETTAIALSWATYVLATNPNVQERLRAEVAKFLEQTPDPNPNDIERFTYLRNFNREVLRLYSPGVLIHRKAITDLVIGGTHVPKGTAIFICPAVMNRSPRVWGPTADEFRPERWDDLTDDASSPYAFEPFSNGPRVCIAKQFAMLEMSVMLIELITCFRFGPSPEQDLNKVEFLNPAITYRSKNGLNIRIEKL